MPHPSPAPVLTPGQVAVAVRHERLALVDLVADLADDAWATPSLCAAWTVRDVLAHLTTTTRLTLPLLARTAVRARFDFDRMEVLLAADRAARFSTDELVGQLRESASSVRRFPGSAPMDPLMDLVVHAQDVARPLRLPYTSPPDVVGACLAHLAGNRFMGGPRRLAGLRVVSQDTGWTSGEGPEVRGADVDLLLAVTGRPAGLDGLSGPGLARLAAQL